MSDPTSGKGKSSHSSAKPKKISKAVLRHEAFQNERLTPLRIKEETETQVEESTVPISLTPGSLWKERMTAYREAQRISFEKAKKRGEEPDKRAMLPDSDLFPEPGSIQAFNRWIPIGPAAVRRGQSANQATMSGRVSSIAIAPGGERIYIGAANGGVWRSLDKGRNWTSLMDDYDLNPSQLASDTQAIGAIALVSGGEPNQDIIYVGSGEAISGHTPGTGTGPYLGVGPVVSFDGGANWHTENVFSSSDPLTGEGFYELAVDPNDSEHVLAATTRGLYRREKVHLPTGNDTFLWRQIDILLFVPGTIGGLPINLSPEVTSVVATTQNGDSVFFATTFKGAILKSLDGHNWELISLGRGNINQRCIIRVLPEEPEFIYLIADDSSPFIDRAPVHELDSFALLELDTAVRLSSLEFSRFSWGLALEISPLDENILFAGGMNVFADVDGNPTSLNSTNGDYSAALYRIEVSQVGNNLSADLQFIGGSVHPDIHAIVFPPGQDNELWVGCDGGVFFTDRPSDSGMIFQSRNAGLQTVMLHHLGPHPTQDSVLISGTQDNGALRFTGEECWLLCQQGDSGYSVIHHENPYEIITTIQGSAPSPFRKSTEGATRGTFQLAGTPFSGNDGRLFYFPMEGEAYGQSPTNPNFLVTGGRFPAFSTDFGNSWARANNDPDFPDFIRAIAVFSENLFYVGTMEGSVWRYERNPGDSTFAQTFLNLAGLPFSGLLLSGPITDIAIDPVNPNGTAIYITFGGNGDFRHVWRFNGISWESTSGTAPFVDGLMDIQHNAIVVDPENHFHLYAGADIGVWRSTDRGNTWSPFSFGLPDVPVIDLKICPNRLLRASTHGRGVYEIRMDENWIPGVELFIRDTQLDQGRFPTINHLDDPVKIGDTVVHWNGPDIKLDFQDSHGEFQFPPGEVDFVKFVDELEDETPTFFARRSLSRGPAKVYAYIHNRGPLYANDVSVTALITQPGLGLPPLPTDYHLAIQNRTEINTPDWQTIGIQTLQDVRPIAPKIAEFDLLESTQPFVGPFTRNQFSVVVLLHHEADEYISTRTNVNFNSKQERKAAQKNTYILPTRFTRGGGLRSERYSPFSGKIWPIEPGFTNLKPVYMLQIIMGGYPGRIRLYLPRKVFSKQMAKQLNGLRRINGMRMYRYWAKEEISTCKKELESKKFRFHRELTEKRLSDIAFLAEQGVCLEIINKKSASIQGLNLPKGTPIPFSLFFEPRKGEPGVGTIYKGRLGMTIQQKEVEEWIAGMDLYLC